MLFNIMYNSMYLVLVLVTSCPLGTFRIQNRHNYIAQNIVFAEGKTSANHVRVTHSLPGQVYHQAYYAYQLTMQRGKFRAQVLPLKLRCCHGRQSKFPLETSSFIDVI